MSPLMLLLLGGSAVAVAAAAGGKKKGGLSHHGVGGFAPNPGGNNPGGGDDASGALGKIIPISRKFTADFRLTSGEYSDVDVPSVCIPGIYCSPPIKVPKGFPDNFIPAGPLVAEVWSGNFPVFMTASLTLWAKGRKRACRRMSFEGEVGLKEGESDVPIRSQTDEEHPNCDYQMGKALPRLTMVTKGQTRRLILMVPPGENGIVTIELGMSLWEML